MFKGSNRFFLWNLLPLVFRVFCRWSWRRGVWSFLQICSWLCVLLNLLISCLCGSHLQQSRLSLHRGKKKDILLFWKMHYLFQVLSFWDLGTAMWRHATALISATVPWFLAWGPEVWGWDFCWVSPQSCWAELTSCWTSCCPGCLLLVADRMKLTFSPNQEPEHTKAITKFKEKC